MDPKNLNGNPPKILQFYDCQSRHTCHYGQVMSLGKKFSRPRTGSYPMHWGPMTRSGWPAIRNNLPDRGMWTRKMRQDMCLKSRLRREFTWKKMIPKRYLCRAAFQRSHNIAKWRFQLRKNGHEGRKNDCQYNFTCRSHTTTISNSTALHLCYS